MLSRRGFAELFATTVPMSGGRDHSTAAHEAKIKVDG